MTQDLMDFWVRVNTDMGKWGGSLRRAAYRVEHFGIWLGIGCESVKLQNIWQPPKQRLGGGHESL